MSYIPNRIVIGALDMGLNRIDMQLRRELTKKKPADELVLSLREERAAMQEARNFVAEKRA